MALCRTILAAVMLEVCRTIFGNRGSGKSEGLKVDLLRLAREGQYAVLVIDKPGTLAREMVGQLSAAGLEKRTLYEKAGDFIRVLRWKFGNQTNPEGPNGKNEHEIEVERFGQIFLSKRKLRNAEDKPYTKEYLDAAVGVYLSQPVPLPLSRILDCFRPGQPGFRELMGKARDRASAITFIEAANRASRNRVQFEIETGAAKRMLKIVNSPVLELRHGDGIDWEEIIANKMQVYLDLSGVKREAARALGIAMYHAAIDACVRHFERTGEPLPLVVCLEECGVMELLTPYAIDCAREYRKAGLSIWTASQTIRDFDEETFETFLGLSDEHHWYFLASGVDRAAKDLSDPTFHATEVHYTRERVVSDGYEEIKTRSYGRSIGPDRKERKDERDGTVFRAKQRVVIEEYYKTPQLHEQEFKTWLAQLRTGERYVRDLKGDRTVRISQYAVKRAEDDRKLREDCLPPHPLLPILTLCHDEDHVRAPGEPVPFPLKLAMAFFAHVDLPQINVPLVHHRVAVVR